MNNLSVLILAAGKSTRLKSKLSKVLHKLAGLPVVAYPIHESLRLKPKKIVLIIGNNQKGQFDEVLGGDVGVEYCIQKDARGTGDAVMSAEAAFKDDSGCLLILPGDVPLISYHVLRGFIKEFEAEKADCAVISTRVPDASGYGRILRNGGNGFFAIREEKDASVTEKNINEINTGIFLAKTRWLFDKLHQIKPHNAQKEYYLTDVIELGIASRDKIIACCMEPFEQFWGINDRLDLAYVRKIMYLNIARHWMLQGVGVVNPEQTYIDSTVRIGEDTTIAPFTFIQGKSVIGKACIIDVGSIIDDTSIDDNVHIKPYSVIEKSRIKEGSIVGPFSRVRPDSLLDKNVRVGNFVEIKKSVLRPGVKANHLSYIGDALIGARTNVGCGTITCNYDGTKKHRTIIGEGTFIGSDTQFVAPVKVGKNAVIGAGSTITKNVPSGALALSRASQINVRGWVAKRKNK